MAEAESGIAFRIERFERILEQIGHSIGAILIQLVVETDECPHLLRCTDLTDVNCAHGRFRFLLSHNYRAKILFFADKFGIRGIKRFKKQHFLIFHDLKDFKDPYDLKGKTQKVTLANITLYDRNHNTI